MYKILFINVPITKTIVYLCNYGEKSGLAASLPIEDMRQLLFFRAYHVQFRLNNDICHQIDGRNGVSTWSTTSRHFYDKVGRWFIRNIHPQPLFMQMLCGRFNQFNSVHPNMKFTTELESNNEIVFLNILYMIRREDGLVRRPVYRKARWNGQSTQFHNFPPLRLGGGETQSDAWQTAERMYTEGTLGAELQAATQFD